MAVPEQTPYSEHTGNGVTKSFALGFICESKDHLIVLVDDTEPPIATWSLTGGDVVFTTAPASGKKIILQRNTPFGRTTDYQSFNNSFRPQSVNGDFDRLWLKLQELGVADWLLKLYVDRLHQQQEVKINDLKSYVDDRDDELRSYLMEEIRKQGVALDQLDDYYNYLMQRLAQIAVDKGWDASFVTYSGVTQERINDGLNSIADMLAIVNPKDGMRVHVKSVNGAEPLGTTLPLKGGGDYRFSTETNKVADGFLVVDAAGGKWLKLVDEATVYDFGAVGDKVTDDSDSFNAYCASPYTGLALVLPNNGRFLIKKQVDLKRKNLIGNSVGKVSELQYDQNSLEVDCSSPDLAGKIAFINCGAQIRDLIVKGSNDHTKEVSFVAIDGFMGNISNVLVLNFHNQFYIENALVGFHVNDVWAYYAVNNSFYCPDPATQTSTTAYFRNIYFQWGGTAFKFDKGCLGFHFENIIFEYMDRGIVAPSMIKSYFNNFWCENTKTGESREWLQLGDGGSWSNYYGIMAFMGGGWTSRVSPMSVPAANSNYSGISADSVAMSFSDRDTSAKITINYQGLHCNGTIRESRFGTSVTPIVKQRMIGADANGGQYLATDAYTKTMRKWGTYNHGSGNSGQFIAPLMLTYDSANAAQQNNAGWTVVKESTGIYRFERVAGNTDTLANPHVVVGGITLGARRGNGTPVVHSIQFQDTFAGSFNDFAQASGFKVFFRDLTGALIDPFRFTVMVTLGSGF